MVIFGVSEICYFGLILVVDYDVYVFIDSLLLLFNIIFEMIFDLFFYIDIETLKKCKNIEVLWLFD